MISSLKTLVAAKLHYDREIVTWWSKQARGLAVRRESFSMPLLSESHVNLSKVLRRKHWEILNKSSYFISVLRCKSWSQWVPVKLLADTRFPSFKTFAWLFRASSSHGTPPQPIFLTLKILWHRQPLSFPGSPDAPPLGNLMKKLAKGADGQPKSTIFCD